MRSASRREISGAVAGLVAAGLAALPGASLQAQDFSVLRINEVIASNATQGPTDVAGSTTDMVEIYNAGDLPLVLGTRDPATSIALSDTLYLPSDDPSTPDVTEPGPWTFRDGITIRPKGFLVIFCDGNEVQNLCEPHANFRISGDGDEPITLWGPVKGYEPNGRPIRDVIDQVWLPPLREDVSFGRYPDGAGPAPVPLEEVLSTFVYNPPGASTFGTCTPLAQTCPEGNVRVCLGKANGPGGNLHPRVELLVASTNHPKAGEPVELRVRVEDEESPLPASIGGAIVRVQAIYRVDSGAERVVDFSYDGEGIRHAPLLDASGDPIQVGPYLGENPFNVWTEWTAAIPGQPAGTRVEFYLACEDSGADGDPATTSDNLSDTSPGSLCDRVYPGGGVGPCDREFGGPGCERDPTDVVRCGGGTDDGGDGAGAADEVFVGVRYKECRKLFTYVSGYVPRPEVEGLFVSEVVASQTRIIEDPTEAGKQCAAGNPFCTYDDVCELHNASDRAIDLSGLWLSDSRFNPRLWRFPEGSTIGPGEYLIVWLDGDGGRCPCPSSTPPDSVYCLRVGNPPSQPQPPCFWDCPDPTNPAAREFHTNFSIDADRDQLYLYDTEENGYGLISGVEWVSLERDCSLSRISNGLAGPCWIETCLDGGGPPPTLGSVNLGECPDLEPKFIRGDATSDCGVDITDAIFILNYLFTGGQPPRCEDAADVNDTGALDISDGIYLLGYLFLGSDPPPYPGPTLPGPDPTADALAPCDPPTC
ncbi:MAG: lamin tail domain-containing protein [Planctomycetota bacterium]